MRFTVVTLLPELVGPTLEAGVVGRAHKAGLLTVTTVNPRDFTTDRHRTVDDTPYGGGPGMVMKAPPVLAAIAAAGALAPEVRPHRVLLAPTGAPLTQAGVRALAAHPHLVLVCGRYEGIDERVAEAAIDETVSVGDFVLSGGELAALAVIDAVARLVPGVLGEPASADDESFSAGLLEYPQYTRPLDLDGRVVPEVLTGGNHAAIAGWRRQQAMRRTAARRPELWARYRPSAGDRVLLAKDPRLAVAARSYVALCHHPVWDRDGKVVTSALTNFDVHDIARSTMTYRLAGYAVVTPITSQRDKALHIARMWSEDQDGQHRAQALALVSPQPSVAATIDWITGRHGGTRPRVVATSARTDGFEGAGRCTAWQLRAELAGDERPLLLLFGTGWGLVDTQVPEVNQVLSPIEGGGDWNHLSVRSAVAVVLDRLFGLAEDPAVHAGPPPA
ncbi:MAG: tRNA (guanosine(37)-N1)-methyltransferase TrmD [Kofleriaceae bacterium]|nr:tRNA (guanosine(37)-N1)-methyltransferase TrmD [Kofleriaceae bacterium]MBP6838740.1 tRNA (guanosine(37)-N1)-methyltransferase TrmD [Kofleriaceae bacterium]